MNILCYAYILRLYSILALTDFIVNLITIIPIYNSFEKFTVHNNPIISTPNLCKTFH